MEEWVNNETNLITKSCHKGIVRKQSFYFRECHHFINLRLACYDLDNEES